MSLFWCLRNSDRLLPTYFSAGSPCCISGRC
jgi:hypothetical protein